MTEIKRIAVLFLAVMVMVTSVPQTAYAVEENPEIHIEPEETTEEEATEEETTEEETTGEEPTEEEPAEEKPTEERAGRKKSQSKKNQQRKNRPIKCLLRKKSR